MKRITALITAALLISVLLSGCGSEKTFIQPTNEFYVNDFADIISSEAEKEMLSRSVSLEQKTSAQVVTVTVNSLDGEEISDYATEIGEKWGVGSKENDNGIVILLSREDRELFIAVGYGLEGALPDSKTGRIIDTYGLDYFKSDDFSEGLLAVSKAIVNEVYIEYGVEPEVGYTSIDLISESSTLSENGGDVFISWIILVAVVIAVMLLSKRRGRRSGFVVMPFFSGSHNNNFHGKGGGSSGGFGGFSGGGGGFGGGGAGRGF